MAGTTLEREIIELETQFWEAIRDRDAETAMALTDDPCVVTGAQGAAVIDREHFAEMLASPDWELPEFELGEPVVRLIGEELAIVAYKVTEKMTVEGSPLTLEAADASTWVRRDGRWLCALHTESVLGDPFGRDRSSNGGAS